MAGINFVRRWVMGQMTKKADDGIMITLPDSSKVDLNVNITMDRLLRNGIDPDAFTNPQQVENALNTIDNRMFNRAIPANSAEGREITEKIFGKQKAPVFDLEGNRIPEGSGIMGGKAVKELMDSGQVTKGARGMKKSKKVEDREMFQAANERLTSDVDTIVKNIKRLSPMDAMKEANLVIGRKGYYKNLTPEESKKILQDTEDHIFERDIPETEDFASGGIAGMLGERPRYQTGGDVAFDASDASVYGSSAISITPETVADAFGNQVQQEMGNTYNPPLIEDVIEEKSVIEDTNKQGIMQNENIADNPNDVDVNKPKNDFLDNFVNPKGPDSLIDKPTTQYQTPDRPTLLGASKPKSDLPGIEFTGITGMAMGPNNPVGVIINGKKTSVSQGLISAYREAVEGARKQRADGFMGRVVLLGEMGIENFMGIYKNQQEQKNSGDPSGGLQAYNPSGLGALGQLKQPLEATAMPFDNPKFDSQITNLRQLPINESPSISEERMAALDRSAIGNGFYDLNKNELGSPLAQTALANGGRAGFAGGGMGRRGFLKLLAGAGAGIAGLKSGLVNILGKGGTKEVAKEVVKQSTSTPPPYFFKLAEKIKNLGDDVTATTDRTISKSLKSKDGKSDYLLEEDMVTGDTIIKKINKEGDEMITDVQIMELRKGEVVKGKDGRPVRTPDQYEEVTEANARIEGDVFNDPYYTDGIEIDDIMREVGEQAPSIRIKKASGGIARMLGE